MEKIKVLCTDQWTATGNIQDHGFADFELGKIVGGDAKAARMIFGGMAKVMEVGLEASPNIGTVWFTEDPVTKKFVCYKYNYDSSD